MVAIRFLGPFRVYSAQHPAQPLRVLTLATDGAIPEAGPQEALLKHSAAQGSLQHLRILSTMDLGDAGLGEEDKPLNPLLGALDDKVSSGHASCLPPRSPYLPGMRIRCMRALYCPAWSTACKDLCQGTLKMQMPGCLLLTWMQPSKVCGILTSTDLMWRAAVNGVRCDS